MREPCADDWLRDRRVAWVWPAAFLTVLVGWLLPPGPGDLLAVAGFAVAGGLCVGNAARCRRVHCAVTGPLYLVAALLLACGAGAPFPRDWVVAGAVAGTVVAFVPEWLGKRYFRGA